MIEVREIIEGAMIDLARTTQQIMRDRGKNATGGTSASIEVMTVGGQGMVQGTMVADKTWRYVGNGRAPGNRPPIEPLKAWIAARNLDLNAYALANRIAQRGTRDYQRRNTNVFIDGIAAWEKKLPGVEEKLAGNLVDRTEQLILQA